MTLCIHIDYKVLKLKYYCCIIPIDIINQAVALIIWPIYMALYKPCTCTVFHEYLML